MFRFWKSVLCLFPSFCLFSSAHVEGLDPLTSAYLSDKEYAKNIEVQAYIVTRDQVAEVFSEGNAVITQKTNKELRRKEIFLLVRCKNFGEYRAYGTLSCKIPNCGGAKLIGIAMMPGYMKSYHDYVIRLADGIISNDDKLPVITCEWKNLYTI